MPVPPPDSAPPTSGLARRQFLRRAGLVAGGLVVGGAAGAVVTDRVGPARPGQAAGGTGDGSTGNTGNAGSPAFYGAHQAGVVSAAPAHLRFLSLRLAPATLQGGRPAIAALQRRMSAAAAQLTAGRWIAEQGSVPAGLGPAGLTVTFGFGAALIQAAGQPVPARLAPLPAFAGETLDARLSGGDLALQICGQDELVVASVALGLTRLAQPAARVAWTQAGFLPGVGSEQPQSTPRNLMGQLDGTDNPTGARQDLAVWLPAGADPSWLVDGTVLVTRRIRMLLERWDPLSVTAKQEVIGRRLDTGAPLTGGTEHSPPAFSDVDAAGRPVIGAKAHVRLTHPANNGGATMLRRGYSFYDSHDNSDGDSEGDSKDGGLAADGAPNAGLFFQAFQADPHAVFVPIQRKLAASDALSAFIRHESSALFAIPPGATPGGWVGETLLS